MTSESIHEFLALAKLRNFASAADELFIAQSTLSRHIMAMEEEFGVALFERSKHKVSLTDAGMMFLPYAERIDDYQNDFQAKMLQTQRLENHILAVGLYSPIPQNPYANMIQAYHFKHPHTHIQIIDAPPASLREILKKGHCDVILTYAAVPWNQDNIEKALLKEDELVAVVPIKHPLTRKKSVSLEDLAGKELILQTEYTDTCTLVNKAFHARQQMPNIIWQLHSLPEIQRLVTQKQADSLLMRQEASWLDQRAVSVIPIEPAVTMGFYVFADREHPARHQASFIQYIQENTEKMRKEAE